jgi:hypothetical protein
VSTPIATLIGGGTGQVGIYNALASGTVYGATLVNEATDGTQVTITLDAAAIAAITGAEGGYIAFGGTLMDPVPEPSTAGLAGLGVTVLVGLAWGRTRASKGRGRAPKSDSSARLLPLKAISSLALKNR